MSSRLLLSPHSLIVPCLLLAASGAAGLRADPTPLPSAAALPITRVTLYTSGVGYFERGGVVDGDATQTLLFPVGQVNDVLKSLVVLDGGGGRIRLVSYGALDPVAKQLQAFSVDLSDNPDPATLLNRLRGAVVTVSYGDGTTAKTVTGTIVGVQTQTVTLPNNGGTTQQSTLTLLADTGLRTIAVAQIGGTQIDDPALRGELKAALAAVAQGRDAGKRPVSLEFTGRGRRSVAVGYLTEAPLWQSSYRLVLGKSPVLQGWAMVQNTSQDDWTDVRLSLVSGRPISFVQDLYTPLYIPRPVVEASVIGSPTPQAYSGSLDTSEVQADAPAPVAAPEPSSSSVARQTKSQPNNLYQYPGLVFGQPGVRPKPSGYVHVRGSDAFQTGYAVDGIQISGGLLAAGGGTSGGKLGTSLFAYNITGPVSVARQKSAMIPFVSGPVQAEAVTVYNPDVQNDHPLSGARLKNTTGLHLMGGPLTVFDEGGEGGQAQSGYVGDALIQDTEPGQTRLLTYAVDLAVDAASESGPHTGHTVSVRIAQGVLIVKHHYEQSEIYTFKNNSAAPRLVVVEHPYHGADWTLLEPAKAEERTADLYRFDLAVPAHASKKLTVREAYPDEQTYALLDGDLPTLLAFTQTAEPTPAVKAALRDVIARRQRLSALQARQEEINSRIQALGQGQGRIRENMRELDRNSPLYARYVGELDAQETTLNALETQKAALQADRVRAQAELSEAVAHLDVD